VINIKIPRPASRRAIFLILVCLAWTLALTAQPQILPPVEIGSDTVVKAPLLKKALLFPTEVPSDSLAPLVPRVLEVKHEPPALMQGLIRPLYLNLGMNSSFGAGLHASYYPTLRFMPLLSLDANLGVPDSNRFLTRTDGHLQTRFGPKFSLDHGLVFQNSRGDDFSSSLFGYFLHNELRELKLGPLEFSGFKTRLSLENLDQSATAVSDVKFIPGFEHSHSLSWKKHNLRNGFWLQDDSHALSIQYKVPFISSATPELDLGLMTDFHRLLPAVDIHKRIVLKPNLYLELSNQAKLRGHSYSQLGEIHPWTLLPEGEQFTLVPLDLSLKAYQLFRQEGFLSMLSFSHNASFAYNEPLLGTLENGNQTILSHQKLLANHSALDLRLNLFGLKLNQSLNLDLEHLPGSDWQRRPYSPMFRAVTSTSFAFGDTEISASFDQAYAQEDELGKQLPEILDLSLSLLYPLSRDLRLKASLANIFNTPYRNYGDLPQAGRTLFVSVSYLPLR